MAEVRQRRSHAIAGLALGVAAGLMTAATLFPVFSVTSSKVSPPQWDAMGISVNGAVAHFAVNLKLFLVLNAGWVALMGLALLLTRIRYVGTVWRVAALISLLAATVLALFLWRFIADPGAAAGDPTWFREIAPDVASGLTNATLDPGIGLYMLLGGSVFGVLAAFVPAFRTEKVIRTDDAKDGLAPGWYPEPNSRARTRYWDGEKWTVGA